MNVPSYVSLAHLASAGKKLEDAALNDPEVKKNLTGFIRLSEGSQAIIFQKDNRVLKVFTDINSTVDSECECMNQYYDRNVAQVIKHSHPAIIEMEFFDGTPWIKSIVQTCPIFLRSFSMK